MCDGSQAAGERKQIGQKEALTAFVCCSNSAKSYGLQRQ